MERYDNNGSQQQGQDSTAGVWLPSSSAPEAVDVTAACSESEACISKNVPVFLDRTFKMIGQVPDDIICWSPAGDSFIIKQVLLLEEALPSFYNHKKFMSFVRQLNFYGFRKVKGGTSPRSKSADGARNGGAAAAAALKEPESWEEYTHPQFRRGRPDLLVDITRKKDHGRSKRKRAEAHQSGILCTLATDLGTVSGGLKAVNNRLDNMMSLLLSMASSPHQAASANPAPDSEDISRYAPVAGGGGVGVSSFAGGGSGFANPAVSSAVPIPAATERGGLGQWNAVEGSDSSGAIRQGVHNPCAHGAPRGYCVAPSFPADQQRQVWEGRALCSQPPQQPYPARLYSALPNIRYLYTAPGDAISTATAITPPAAARAPESGAIGSSRQQQPPLHLPRPWFSNDPSSDGNEGGRIKNSCAVSPPKPKALLHLRPLQTPLRRPGSITNQMQ